MCRRFTLSGPALVAGLLLAPLLVLGVVAAGAQTEIDRVVPASAGSEITIENIAGSVTVTGWDRSEVRIRGTLGRGVEPLEVTRDGGSILIEVDARRGPGRGDAEAHLQIEVPRSSPVEIETIVAAVAVSGLDGDVTVETVSGSLRVEGRPRRLEVETVSGEIDLVDGAGRVSIETVSGPVVVRGALDELEVETVNGGVDLQTDRLQRADLESVSGSLRLAFSPARGADIEMSSHSGSLEVIVPADVSARIEATTRSGRIRSDLGPKPQRTSRYGPEQELSFTAGDGAATLRLETFSGDLRLRVR